VAQGPQPIQRRTRVDGSAGVQDDGARSQAGGLQLFQGGR
jgi:hypothetical protein